jgi:metal-responsive CopG/Arc/MetJ family transcriptional regulator
MAAITLPDELLQKLEQVLPESISAEEFVADAVREKLAFHRRKTEFYRLSDETRRRMIEHGCSEAEIMSDFDAFRARQAE